MEQNFIPEKAIDPILIPCEEIRRAYNEICTNLTPCSGLSFSRRKNIEERWKEHPGMDYWKDVFRKANSVRTDSGWKPSFDWIFKDDTNYLKIIEGQLEDNKASPKGIDFSKFNFSGERKDE